MPYRDYLCDYCGHQFEELVMSRDPDEYGHAKCPHCDSRAKLLPALIGGYSGHMGGASTRPKNSSAMKKASVFTGYDEPETEIPEIDED